jgi:hypothetical protein
LVATRERTAAPLVELRLGHLDQIAAGVVEHRGGDAAQFNRILRKADAEAAQSLELRVNVVNGK